MPYNSGGPHHAVRDGVNMLRPLGSLAMIVYLTSVYADVVHVVISVVIYWIIREQGMPFAQSPMLIYIGLVAMCWPCASTSLD